jgi:prophage antirepressor-like protein
MASSHRRASEMLWFLLADVCRELEIANPRDVAAKQLDDDEKDVDTIYTLGGPQQMLIVSEAGFYKLSFTSRKPNAKRFVRWVDARGFAGQPINN